MRRLVFVALLLATSGCISTSRDTYSLFANDDDEATAHRFLALMHDGDVAGARSMLAPGVDKAPDEAWGTMQGILAPADLPTAYLVGAHTNFMNGERSATLVYEGPRDEGYFVAQLGIHDGVITGFQLWQNKWTLEEENRFMRHLSLPGLLFLLLGSGTFLLSILTFRAVLRSDVPARKRWAFVSLLGAVALSLNWSTGAYGLQRLTLKLPVFLFEKAGPDAPWVFTVLFPLGALLAAERLRQYRRKQATVQEPTWKPEDTWAEPEAQPGYDGP